MEMPAVRRSSRRKKRKGQLKKDKKASHFRTVRFGGFEEVQLICYLWDIVKTIEFIESAETDQAGGSGQKKADAVSLEELHKRTRERVRVEMRRYFLRRKRRNMKLILKMCSIVLCVTGLFGFLIGIDRVSGSSMYPYLNNGDWIVYSRTGGPIQRGEVVVFEKNGENMVKRVTGLPGDIVEISSFGYHVVINGVQVKENYVAMTEKLPEQEGDGNADQMSLPLTVMEDQYLVLGDNRSVSIDSRDRDIGTVPKEDVLGRVILVVRTNG